MRKEILRYLQILNGHNEALPIVRLLGQDYISGLWIAPDKDFFAPEPELGGQTDGLAASGWEEFCCLPDVLCHKNNVTRKWYTSRYLSAASRYLTCPSAQDKRNRSNPTTHVLVPAPLCRPGIVVVSHEDDAEGTMIETAEGGRFTKVTLHPAIAGGHPNLSIVVVD